MLLRYRTPIFIYWWLRQFGNVSSLIIRYWWCDGDGGFTGSWRSDSDRLPQTHRVFGCDFQPTPHGGGDVGRN
jgi:hypothetical protein